MKSCLRPSMTRPRGCISIVMWLRPGLRRKGLWVRQRSMTLLGSEMPVLKKSPTALPRRCCSDPTSSPVMMLPRNRGYFRSLWRSLGSGWPQTA